MYSAISADLGTLPNFPPRSHSPRYPDAAATMPRARFSNRGWWPVVMLMVALFLAPTGPAWGASIQVETTDAISTTDCTLADAITTAKDRASYGMCQWSGNRKVALEAEIYDTAGVLPFIIPSGVSITISGVGGSAAATIMRDADADATNRFFNVFGTLDLSNVTLTGGKQSLGGAIRVFGAGDLKLSFCRLVDNSATSVGGAIYSAGTFDVTSSIFDGNSAGTFGGAMFVSSSTSTLGSTFTIDKSTFVDNFAGIYGGAITAYSGALGISNSTFSANEASRGGAIEQRSSAYTLVEMCTFKGNSSTLKGSGGTLDLEKSALAGTNLCFGTINSLGNNAAEDSSCGLTATGDQVVADLHLSDLVDNHGGRALVHVPLCPWTGPNGECDSPLIEQYACLGLGETTGQPVRDQRNQFPRKDLINFGISGEFCDIGAYESICTDVQDVSNSLQRVVLHGFQSSGSTELLDNGGCYSHTLAFEATSNCRVEWLVDTQLVISDVIRVDSNCAYDCFAQPEMCATNCALPDPTGWNESVVSGLYGFDIPSCANNESFNYVVEYHHSLTPNELKYWDPINEINQ